MSLQDLVIRSQLIPPRQRKGVLRRPRLEARLAAILDHPLTLVQAGTGYGKSTALASLAGSVERLYWYSIAEPDRDPMLFLVNLLCAMGCGPGEPGEAALDALEAPGGRIGREALTPLLNALTRSLDRDVVLVLDDYHLVAGAPDIASLVEQLVDYAPANLHVVIASRSMPALAALPRWRAKGQVLMLGQADLAFTAGEIETLFREQYDFPLSARHAEALAAETEGWAIVLPMVWQSLQGEQVDVGSTLARLPSTLDALFDYLARDVLARQPAAVQRFMLATSVLHELDGPRCDYVLEGHGGAAMLRRLQDGGLFVVSLGEATYRYHRLFHDFLQAQLKRDPEQARALHRRAAAYFERAGQPEETVYHALEAGDYPHAAHLVQELGPRLVAVGRLESLLGWIDRLPDELRAARPGLDVLLGDALRLRADFDQALEVYTRAEERYGEAGDRPGRSRALRGQAQVYLDTIRPIKADSLLESALRLLDPQEHRQEVAALLEQLAENKLNLGLPDQAQELHHEARLLRAEVDPDDIYLEARALLRTGRLAAGQELLEARLLEESLAGPSRPQRFHRETVLLLSLLAVLQGNGQAADRYARQGITLGERLQSPYVQAVGYMRLGHAVQLGGLRAWSDWEQQEAIRHYHRAIELVHVFKVMRVQVEPLWGLCRALGLRGDWAAAERHARQALDIVEQSGDEWMGQLVRTTLGAGYTVAGRAEEAGRQLAEAGDGLGRVGDPFGQAAAWLWRALLAWRQGDADRAMEVAACLLPRAREQGYDRLLSRRTFLGLENDQAAVPLLIEAQRRGIEAAYAARLLQGMGLEGVESHPGYGLGVQTLGRFAAYRGTEPVTARDWQREKARQLFQFLLTQRGQWLHRDQIVDQLWPHLPPDAAERDFKVALNALNRALEPARPQGGSPFFVVRRGNLYGLNPAARLDVDADGFERLAASSEPDALRRALDLYQDDYLPDSLYEDWTYATRERLRGLYLSAAERLAAWLLAGGEPGQAIQVGRALLARDRTWEPAYRLLMQAYAAQGNRAQVHAAYRQCAAALHDELGVEPSPETRALYGQLVSD